MNATEDLGTGLHSNADGLDTAPIQLEVEGNFLERDVPVHLTPRKLTPNLPTSFSQ
jgi:hypothetical protein